MTSLKLVILGGTGFVGRALVSRLAADGHAVTLLSRNLASHAERLVPPGVDLREIGFLSLLGLAWTLRTTLAGGPPPGALVGVP